MPDDIDDDIEDYRRYGLITKIFHHGIDDAKFDSVSTGSAITERVGIDYSKAFPQSPRQPESQPAFGLTPHPDADNPVITLDDVDDVSLGSSPLGVADPFMVYDGTYHIFAECLLDESTSPADYRIGHWTSQDGLSWQYDQMVIEDSNEQFAYPYTFKAEGNWYMTPTGNPDNVDLYRANPFPADWEIVASPLSNLSWNRNDPTIIYLPEINGEPYDSSGLEWDGTYYLFVDDVTNSTLRLFYSGTLESNNWSEHPSSPITSDPAMEKLGGRPFVGPNHVDLIHRSPEGSGEFVTASRIDQLSRTSAATPEMWSKSPIVQGTRAVDQSGSTAFHDGSPHHMDMMIPQNGADPIAVVDGQSDQGSYYGYELGIYTVGDRTPYLLATKTSDQVLSNGDGTTKVTFGALRDDTGRGWDANNNEYHLPRSGRWRANLQLRVTPDVSGGPVEGFVIVSCNGRNLAESRFVFTESFDYTVNASGYQYLQKSAGPVSVDIRFLSSASQTINGNNSSCYFTMEYLGQ